jgi:hypothetical protein
MSTLITDVRAERIWIDDEYLWVLFVDGRQLAVPLAYFPRLLNATPEQRKNFIISGNGTGIHWDCIDEDISVEGLLRGFGDTTSRI